MVQKANDDADETLFWFLLSELYIQIHILTNSPNPAADTLSVVRTLLASQHRPTDF